MTPRFRFVFFDVEAALVTIDAFAELSRRTGRTAQSGAAFARRLEVLRPTAADIDLLGQAYLDSLAPGAVETITTLQTAGTHVRLVSDGIAQALEPLARHLGILARNTLAIPLHFDAAGVYAGCDERSLLTQPDGKELTVRSILARSKGRSAYVGAAADGLVPTRMVDLFVDLGSGDVPSTSGDGSVVRVGGPSLTAVLPYLVEGR